jgi:hypothetical protein
MRHYYRGRVFESTGELDIAVEEYSKAVELGADYADVHNSLGRTYAKKGFFEEAKNEFNYALELNPQYLEAQRNLDELEAKLALIEKENIPPQGQVVTHAVPKRKLISIIRIAKRRYLKRAVTAGVICLMIGISVVIIPGIVPKATVATYISPSTNITGIMRDGRMLWLCDWLKQEIYQCEISNDGGLSIKHIYSMPKVYPVGITVGDGYLWTCDAWSKKIRQHVIDANLTVIKSYNSPGDNPSGLSWDGRNIWSCDLTAGKIYRHGTDEKLTVKASFPTAVKRLVGFFWDGKYYWSVDSAKGVLYKHKKDAKLSIVASYAIDLPNKKLGGIFLDKKYIWVAFEGEELIVRYPRSKILH